MTHNLLTKWLVPRQSCERQGQHRRPAAWSRRYPRLLERLEDDIAPSIVTPFTIQFSDNVTGDLAIIVVLCNLRQYRRLPFPPP
jgi:hypothetical protein